MEFSFEVKMLSYSQFFKGEWIQSYSQLWWFILDLIPDLIPDLFKKSWERRIPFPTFGDWNEKL